MRFSDPQLKMAQGQSSDVRCVLSTTAETLEVVTHPSRVVDRGAERPRGHLDLLIDGELVHRDELTGGSYTEVDMSTGASRQLTGHRTPVCFPGCRRDPRWLRSGCTTAGPSATIQRRHAPSGISLAVAVRLGGNALVDPFTVQVMRDTPANFMSEKLGINVMNMDSMRLGAFVPAGHGLLDTIREGPPETPLVLVSPIFCGIHEDTSGPGAFDPASFGTDQLKFMATGSPEGAAAGQLTLRVIREALASLVERRAEDPNLYYLDGLSLYGERNAQENPLHDALHPDCTTHPVDRGAICEVCVCRGGAVRARLEG